jgi:hypothetical protein
VCGESGKKNLDRASTEVSSSSADKSRSIYQKRIETKKVMTPVIIISLRYDQFVSFITLHIHDNTHHCQGMNLLCLMCKRPNAIRPSMIMAAPFIRTKCGD